MYRIIKGNSMMKHQTSLPYMHGLNRFQGIPMIMFVDRSNPINDASRLRIRKFHRFRLDYLFKVNYKMI